MGFGFKVVVLIPIDRPKEKARDYNCPENRYGDQNVENFHGDNYAVCAL